MKRRTSADLLADISTVIAESDKLATQLAFDRLDAAMAVGAGTPELDESMRLPAEYNEEGCVPSLVFHGLGDMCITSASAARVHPAWLCDTRLKTFVVGPSSVSAAGQIPVGNNRWKFDPWLADRITETSNT